MSIVISKPASLFCALLRTVVIAWMAPLALAQTAAAPTNPGESQLATLEKELDTTPGWTEGWWKLGTAAYDANRFDLAITSLGHVVQAAPQMALAWTLLGLSEYETKQYGAARANLEKGLQLGNSADPEVERVAAYHLALLRIRDGDFSAAQTLLQTTFGAAPNAQASEALGLASLRVPLLPEETAVSREALLLHVGDAVARGSQGLADLRATVTANADIPFLHLAYAKALEQVGRRDEALVELRRETEISAHSPIAWRALAEEERAARHKDAAARAEAKASAMLARSGTVPDENRQLFEKAPQETQIADRNAGMQAYANGNYEKARDKLSAWVVAHKEDGTAWAVLGLSEFRLTRFDDALLHLQRGIAIGVQAGAQAEASAHFTLGTLFLRNGEFRRAADELQRAHSLGIEGEQLNVSLGYALLRHAALPPSEPDGLATAAGHIEMFLLESRYDLAIPAFQHLLATQANVPNLHYAFGTALMALSEFREATMQMQAELAVNPHNGLAHQALASIALREKRPADSIPEAKRAVDLMPQAAEPHYLLGRALLESGADLAEATREMEQAEHLSPNSPEVHFSLARAYARASDNDKAAHERAEFARLNALAESEKSGHGPQTYAGPRDGDLLSGSSKATEPY